MFIKFKLNVNHFIITRDKYYCFPVAVTDYIMTRVTHLLCSSTMDIESSMIYFATKMSKKTYLGAVLEHAEPYVSLLTCAVM